MKFRKKLFAVVVAVLMITNVLAVSAEERTNVPEVKAYVKVSTSLKMREGPSTSYGVLSTLNPGELLIVEETLDNGWSKVKRLEDETEGYVSNEYIVIPEVDSQKDLISVAVITSNSSSKNRNFNMAKACECINGLILEPGDEFNWYGDEDTEAVVGEASKANGYKQANIILGGKYVKGDGGGVCQVSTAVYNCIYKLEIIPTELHHHSLTSTYVEKGMDATVAYPSKNFVFENTKDYSIMFEAYTDGGQVIVAAYKILE